MVAESDWSGLLRGRRGDQHDLSVVAVVSSSGNSFGNPIQVIASDNRQYWVKNLNGCPAVAQASLAIEFVVSGVGRLIGAPVCETKVIRIPEELDGTVLPGGKLHSGLGHASLAVERAIERRHTLSARSLDDNSRRHAGIYALWDWCFGADGQWLYDMNADQALYSHDHGLYFPPNDGTCSPRLLRQTVDVPNELEDPPDGLNLEAVEDAARALEQIDREALVKILCGVPASWPVRDDDLEAIGWYLESRAPAVAHRLRTMIRREV